MNPLARLEPLQDPPIQPVKQLPADHEHQWRDEGHAQDRQQQRVQQVVGPSGSRAHHRSMSLTALRDERSLEADEVQDVEAAVAVAIGRLVTGSELLLEADEIQHVELRVAVAVREAESRSLRVEEDRQVLLLAGHVEQGGLGVVIETLAVAEDLIGLHSARVCSPSNSYS